MSILVGATFLTAALVLAFADATFVLKNGDRASGQLTYHVGSGDLGVTQNGKERMFPFDDIAVIQFTGGDPSRLELEKLPNSDNPPERVVHMVVLKSGETVHGKYHGFQGDQMTFDVWDRGGAANRRTFNLNDVARLYLSASGARKVFSTILNDRPAPPPPPSPPPAPARDDRPDRSVQVIVPANMTWTDTGLIVNQGERIRFEATGTIKIDPKISTGPEGSESMPRRRSFPVPTMGVGGLVARVGNAGTLAFQIGSKTIPIEMPAAGRLYLGINDDMFTDNSGSYTVKIYR
jgi:hypothetical protein